MAVSNIYSAVSDGCEAMKWELLTTPAPRTLEERVRFQEYAKAWIYAVKVLLEQAERERTNPQPSSDERPFYRSRYSERQISIGDVTYGGCVQNLFNHLSEQRSLSETLNQNQLCLFHNINELRAQLNRVHSKRDFDKVFRTWRAALHKWDDLAEVEHIIQNMRGTSAFLRAEQDFLRSHALLAEIT